MTRRVIGLLFLFLVGSGSILWAQEQTDPFKVKFDDSIRDIMPGGGFVFAVKFSIPPGHYLYDEKTSVLFEKTEDILLLKSERPAPERHFDPFLKKDTPVYFKEFTQKFFFSVPKEAKPGRRTLEATIRYQGCSQEFCYRPIHKKVLLPVEVLAHPGGITTGGEGSAQPAGPSVGAPQRKFWELLEETNPERLLELGKVPLLGLALLGGILTSFTPCVLPIIPLTLAFIGVRHRRRGNILRAVLLVAGMVVMYSMLGFLAAALGMQLGFLFQSRWFVLFTALFFLLFALGLFEIIPFHLPHRLHNRLAKMGGEGPLGAFLAGLTVGLVASPCVGPLIAPLLLIAARTQDRFYGFFLLFNYGMGMGILFLILGSAYAELAGKVRSGKWTHALKRFLGVLMLLPALYYGYAFAKPLVGMGKDPLWVHSLEQGLAAARESGKPLLIDFFAQWCPPCVELDQRTFSTAEFRDFGQSFILLKIDCTEEDANCQQATEKYKIVGMPSVLFAFPDGSLIEGVKWIGGFADKDKMLTLMREALEKTKQRPEPGLP